MDVVIHNAEEATAVCLPHISWLDYDASLIIECVASSDGPPKVWPDSIRRVCPDVIYKVEEVPCGWCVFYGLPEFVKQMRETGKADDSLKLIGGWPFLVNRWTGKADTISWAYLPTMKAAVQDYIYHLPEDQRIACRLPQFNSVWKPDPIRFCPAKPAHVEVDDVNALEDIRFVLEVDDNGQYLLIGNDPNLAGLSVYSKLPDVRTCSIVDIKHDGATKTYILKPEFEKTQIRERGWVSDKIILSTHESETFPDGVWIVFYAKIGK